MGDTMSYATIRLPVPLTDEVDEVVKTGYRGYRSRAEFVTDAIRRFLDEVPKEEKEEVPA